MTLIRGYCTSSDILVVTRVLAIRTCLVFTFGTDDIKGSFMESWPIEREVYFNPSIDFFRRREILWRLRKLPYYVIDVGRQWMSKTKKWMTNDYGLERVFGVAQLCVKHEGNRIVLLVAKYTDNILISRAEREVERFAGELSKSFQVGKIFIGDRFKLNGCEVSVNDIYTDLTMLYYVDTIYTISLATGRRWERVESLQLMMIVHIGYQPVY